MKLQMKKDQLLGVLNKMVDVATKAIKSETESVGKLTIEVDPKQVTFKSTNGYLNVIYKITPDQDASISKSERGTFSVDASVFRNVIKTISTKSEDSVISIDMDGDMLRVLSAGSKLKKYAKLQVLSSHHDFTIEKPKGTTLKLETDIFTRGIDRVSPFVSKLGYDVRFQMICLHFFAEQTRYICGDGGCFAIYEYPQKNNITEEEGLQCLIPSNQAFILQNLLNGVPNFDLIIKKGEYYFHGGPLTASLQGVAVDEYVNYSIHAYQHDKATAIFDVDAQDLVDAMSLVGAIKDKDGEVEGDVHSFKLSAVDGKIEILVDGSKAKYRCDIDKPCSFYKISKDAFNSEYAYVYMRGIASAVVDPQARFYCISEDDGGIIVVESVKVSSTEKDAKGIPAAERPDKDRLLFFCAATRNV